MESDYVMVGEAARILHRGAETVLNYERSGRLPPASRQAFTNNRLWPRSVIEKLAAELKVREPVSVL